MKAGGPIAKQIKQMEANLSQTAMATVVIYQLAICSIKITFLLQYRRVFPLPNIQRLCDLFIALILCWAISQIVISNMSCFPSKAGETGEGKPTKTCVDQIKWWLSNAIINLVTDLVIFFMPLCLIYMLRLEKTQKAILLCVFGLGFLYDLELHPRSGAR